MINMIENKIMRHHLKQVIEKSVRQKGLSDQATGGARSEALVTEKLSTLSSRKDGGCFGEETMVDGICNPETGTKNTGVETLKNELVV